MLNIIFFLATFTSLCIIIFILAQSNLPRYIYISGIHSFDFSEWYMRKLNIVALQSNNYILFNNYNSSNIPFHHRFQLIIINRASWDLQLQVLYYLMFFSLRKHCSHLSTCIWMHQYWSTRAFIPHITYIRRQMS